jgi:hypothetical protein
MRYKDHQPCGAFFFFLLYWLFTRCFSISCTLSHLRSDRPPIFPLNVLLLLILELRFVLLISLLHSFFFLLELINFFFTFQLYENRYMEFI